MGFLKGKTMVEKAQDQQARVQMKQLKLQEIRTEGQMRAEKEKMQSAEMRRLRA